MTAALRQPTSAHAHSSSHARRRAQLARLAQRWHRRLGWIGGVALIIFGLSGLTHPLMTWFGPQPAVFFPPQAQVTEETLARLTPLLQTLAGQGLTQANVIKLVPTPQDEALQVTLPNDPERRYFSLDGAELVDADARQAEWLARYYTGLSDTPLRELSLQTDFDDAYPEVNRLLPVWKATFATDDGLTAFIHTELNALASLTNTFRTSQQSVFRALHTFSWLDSAEPLRVTGMAVLCAGLILMSLSGAVLVFALPARTLPHGQRRWHRWLALGLWVPLLAFSTSGLYHLLHQSSRPVMDGLRHAPPLDLSPLQPSATSPMSPRDGQAVHDNAAHSQPGHLNSVTLLQGPDGLLYFRLGQPNGRAGEAVHHHARFDGIPTERTSPLLHAGDLTSATLDEAALMRHFAALHLHVDPADILAMRPVTRFGPEYDFRNKRLPVWRVQHDNDIVFIDPANGALVDRISRTDRWEGFSFSHLHKWNFLTPLTGRELRDGLVTAVIGLALLLNALGFAMLIRSVRRKNAG